LLEGDGRVVITSLSDGKQFCTAEEAAKVVLEVMACGYGPGCK